MVKIIGITILVAIIHLTYAEDGTAGSVSDWWDNVYEQKIKKEQYQQYQQDSATRCQTKITWYQDRVTKDPSSDYYQFKLKSWQDRCVDEAKSNPYVVPQ